MAPNKVNQIRGRLHSLNRKTAWDSSAQGEAAGLLGYIKQVYPEKLPSKLHAVVTATQARLQHEAVGRWEAVVAAAKDSQSLEDIEDKKSKRSRKTTKKANEELEDVPFTP